MKKPIPEISAYTHTPDLAPSEKHDLECDLCGKKWNAVLASVTYRARKAGRTIGCPDCAKEAHRQHLLTDHHRKASNTSVEDELARIGFKLLEPYTNAKGKLLMQCVCCGSKWDNSTVLSRKQTAKKYDAVGCAHCSDAQRQTFKNRNVQTLADLDTLDMSNVDTKAEQKKQQLATALIDYNNRFNDARIQITGNFTSPYETADFTCMDCGHEFSVIPNTKLVGLTSHGCPKCATAIRMDQTTQLREAWIEELGGTIVGETDTRYKITCNLHTFSVAKTAVRGLSSFDEFMPSDEPSRKLQVVLDRIEAADVTLLEPYQGFNAHIKAKCGVCGHGANGEWITTPHIISQSLRIYGNSSCPECSIKRRYGSKREVVKEKIHRRGFTILSEYDGRQTTVDKIRVRRESCGHEFESAPGNILHNNLECPVCNLEAKRQRLAEINRQTHEEWLETAEEWEAYRSEVTSLTTIAYNQHKSVINPDNHPRGKAGVDGAYHLDHIVSVRYCFENLIPPELCGHVDNLQMLPWWDNVSKSDKVDMSNLPSHIQMFMEANNMV